MCGGVGGFASVIKAFTLTLFPLLPIATRSIARPRLTFPNTRKFNHCTINNHCNRICRIAGLGSSNRNSLHSTIDRPGQVIIFSISNMVRTGSIVPFTGGLAVTTRATPKGNVIVCKGHISFSKTSGVVYHCLQMHCNCRRSPNKCMSTTKITFNSGVVFSRLSIA